MWGDRLLDGSNTGLGMWEASENNTHPAILEIPRDVVICDWHYEHTEPTPAYFAQLGFRVIACGWNRPEVTRAHANQMALLRQQANPILAERFLGVMNTVWSPANEFLDKLDNDPTDGEVQSFRILDQNMN